MRLNGDKNDLNYSKREQLSVINNKQYFFRYIFSIRTYIYKDFAVKIQTLLLCFTDRPLLGETKRH